jgi:hypothetical protein
MMKNLIDSFLYTTITIEILIALYVVIGLAVAIFKQAVL